MSNFTLNTKKYPQEGDLQHTYSPLKNIMDENNKIVEFKTSDLEFNLNHPLNIECQPTYDGTVNLIINDDLNPPRIINSRFSKIEDNKFRVINRNQSEQTNIYKEKELDLTTRLFRTISKIPKFSFVELNYFGQLKGGNYTFYAKFADDDYNKTDVVCESGQISIFKGNLFEINSISGTLQDEQTDKSIKLLLKNIDETFSKVYIYYTREYSDTNGFRMSETVMITTPYDITGPEMSIIINGFENTQLISDSELNIQYNYVTNAKTQAQVQNMLFFGNVESTNIDIKNLQNISYFFKVTLKQRDKSIGWIDPNTYIPSSNSEESLEYYDPKNIYYNLGYWPGEIYRLGVVYIMNDDSLSPVFNLRGCVLSDINSDNWSDKIVYKSKDALGNLITNYLERDCVLSNENGLMNTFGVFKNPDESESTSIYNFKYKTTKPWYYNIEFPDDFDYASELRNFGVKGYFFVRQKRIPTTLCQGLSIAIDESSSIPMLYIGDNYKAESFIDGNCELNKSFTSRLVTSKNKKGSAILSVEASVTPTLRSLFDGSSFLLQKNRGKGIAEQDLSEIRHYYVDYKTDEIHNSMKSAKCIYINSNIPYKYVDGYGFSSRAGNAESVHEFSFFGELKDSEKYKKDQNKLVRGVYCPYIGVLTNLEDNALYNIKIDNYSHQYMQDYFNIRKDDNSAFYSISDRFDLNDQSSHDIYRGDCYTSTVTVRLNRNFVDPDFPINDTIIDSKTWKSHYNGFLNTNINDKDGEPDGNWALINRGDLNAVPMGMWVTYKCLSNKNLNLRSEDRAYTNEMALMGTPRGFYPLHGISTKSSNKLDESWILNDGYASTVNKRNYVLAPNAPYIQDLFDNRIMFSNVQVDGDFKNGYRIFQGLSYKDIDRQYGAIVKLIPWGVNLFCVFEHGLAIIPVNEKALIQTTTEQSIHMYGAGVLQSQVSLITPDFGSTWPESIIRTPIGIYGVDTYAKKIWKYSDKSGFETISDMKVQRFLNDNISLRETDKFPLIGLKNVKSHYNNYKGDVMFTFYNFMEGKEWNLCFNERMNKWITRYSWIPLYSENINNIFYSLDKKRSEILGHIYNNRTCKHGIRTTLNEWSFKDGKLTNRFETELSFAGESVTDFSVQIKSAESSYILNNREYNVNIPIDIFKFDENKLYWNFTEMKKVLEDVSEELGYEVPLYYKINADVTYKINDISSNEVLNTTIGIVVDFNYSKEKYEELLCNGFYVHGKAGIFDEVDIIKPTYWYNKQEPFEFEFVVNEPVGLHKIFDNLVIISNKAQPNSIEIEVIGDVYDFKKSGLLNNTEFKNTFIKYDPVLNQKMLITNQECKNIENIGRRLGNIHYKEDSWYLTIEPIKFRNNKNPEWSSARIRDKFAKIRIKYSGEDQVLVTAIKSLLNITNS